MYATDSLLFVVFMLFWFWDLHHFNCSLDLSRLITSRCVFKHCTMLFYPCDTDLSFCKCTVYSMDNNTPCMSSQCFLFAEYCMLLFVIKRLQQLLHLNLAQVCRGDFDRDISEVGEELRLWRMRCQLQIYTPPLAHCTSLKPEAARSGFISVPAHTGCSRAPHTDLSQLSFGTAFPAKREMEADETSTCTWDEIHFGKSTSILWLKITSFFLLPSFSPHHGSHYTQCQWG